MQTSRSHWYTFIAVSRLTLASSAASPTGYCLIHQYRRTSHFCSGNLLLLKKLPTLRDFVVLQLRHRKIDPSDISLLLPSVMEAWQVPQVLLVASNPFCWRKVYTAKQEVGYVQYRQCCSSSHDFLLWFSRHSFIAHAYNT